MTGAAAVLSIAIALGSQTAQPQSPPSTGLIVGRVVDAASGRPVGGVVVSLNGGNAPVAPSPQAAAGQPRAMTNANGQFVFRKLAKGSYSLTAARPGYVPGAYGRRSPGGTPAQLQLEEGQRVGDVVIPIWRHATITGTVIDEAGEPMIGVQVRGFQRRVWGGRRRLVPGPQATTDDRGIYRLTSLAPGDYFVAFVWRETSVPLATAELLRNGIQNDPKAQEIFRERISLGGAVVLDGPGSASVLQVGGMVVDLPPGSPVPPAPPDAGAVYIYPTQFYPGVPSAARATPVTLVSGQEREGVDFSLSPVKTFRVAGTVMGPEGPMANMTVRLAPANDEAMTDLETSAAMTGAGGDFLLLGVPPGQYTVKALRVPRPSIPTPSSTTMTQIQVGSSTVMTSSSGPPNPSAAPPPVSDDPTLFAEQPITIGNRDATDLLLTLQRGGRVTGRVEFDGMRERPDATALVRVQVVLDRADAVPTAGPFNAPPPGHADETGAFKTYGVAPGRYLVRVNGAPTGWTLKSVISEGRDVSEAPLDLGTTDATGVVITFTDRPTKLTGVARGANGNPDADAVVVVFPTDTNGWSDYGINPRRVRSTHAARDGTFTFSGLPAGEYYVAAIHEDTTPQWQDASTLENLARGASQIRLADGDTRTQDVKTVKGGSQ
jgi:Carboxypeptidase regulatory-like domain